MEFAINRFHEIVNQGPLYVCTCCDQLWYKHSVRCTNKLRQSKPDIVKYLLNKTTQFAVGRTRSVQVVRKQFPLRPAAAKTIHRSQGDTESRIVVNLETRRAIPLIHYVALSRVTTINGLFITDLCEDKIAVSNDVQTEMQRLRTEGQLPLSIKPIYELKHQIIVSRSVFSMHDHYMNT